MYRIVLASASPRRKELLSQIGLEYTVIPSAAEEVRRFSEPDKMVEDLSLRKALDAAQKAESGTIVIGADTAVAADGIVLGKPKDEDDAVRMLTLLQGREHQVYTGVTVLVKRTSESEINTFSEKTEVSIYPMSAEEIRRYVAAGESMDKAGAYGIQGAFAAYVKKIDGCYYNVMGLPIGRLYQELKKYIEE